MYKIGLTGGIASGKSTVTRMLIELGAEVIDTDILAREIVRPGQPAWQDIVKAFGPRILLPDQNLNRVLLGELVFNDNSLLKVLEDFTHPRIAAEVGKLAAKAEESGERVIVLDVPLLFEIGWQARVDETWLVAVSSAVQLKRLMERDAIDAEQAQKRINAQWPIDKKCKLADIVIDNSASLERTKEQVVEAWIGVQDKLMLLL